MESRASMAMMIRLPDNALRVIAYRRETANPQSIATARAGLAPIVIMDSGLLASLGPAMTNPKYQGY
jgi:hypothetical protein